MAKQAAKIWSSDNLLQKETLRDNNGKSIDSSELIRHIRKERPKLQIESKVHAQFMRQNAPFIVRSRPVAPHVIFERYKVFAPPCVKKESIKHQPSLLDFGYIGDFHWE